MTKLIVFDLEGTLIKEEFLVEIAREVGKEKEIKKITEDGLSGKIEWTEGLKKRIALLKDLDKSAVEKRASSFTIIEGAEDFIGKAKQLGYKTAIISGGFDTLAQKVADCLDIDFCISNKMVFSNQKLSGVVINVNSNKEKWMKKIAKKCGADTTIAFGDGANDIKMLRESDYGIFLKEKNFHIFIDILENIKRCKNV